MPVPTKENVSRPLAAGYDVLIEYGDTDAESLYLRAAVGPGRQLAFQTVEPDAKGPSLVENPEDMRSVSGSIFSRSDFSGGEGLRFAHRRDGTDQDFSRYWRSAGLFIRRDDDGRPLPLRLAHEAELWYEKPDDLRAQEPGPVSFQRSSGGVWSTHLILGYFSNDDAATVAILSDLDAASPTVTFSDSNVVSGSGHTGDHCTDILRVRNTVYVVLDEGHIHRMAGSVWAEHSIVGDDNGPVRLWHVKSRMISAEENEIREVVENGASEDDSPLLISTEFAFTDVVDGGTAILAATEGGPIYIMAEEAGELVLVGQTEIPNESVWRMAATSGLVFILTHPNSGNRFNQQYSPARLWRGAVVGNRIANLQLLRQWDGVGRSITVDGERILVVIAEADDTAALWEYDLVTGGLHRSLEFAAVPDDEALIPREAQYVVRVEDRLFALVGRGLYRENPGRYVTSGHLILPLADFYNDEPKAWAEVRMHLGDMPAGTSASLAYSTDPAAIDDPSHASWVTAINAATTTGEHSADLIDVESRWIALKVTLATSDATKTPEVLSMAARALLKPTETDWQIPINVSDRLEMPHRKPLLVPGLGEQVRESMQALVGKVATVTLLRPDEQIVGQITGVSEPIQEIPERGSPSVYALLQIRGERQTS